MEAIKIIAQYGATLAGRMLHYDATDSRMREITLRRDPDCALCGQSPSISRPVAGGENGTKSWRLREIDAASARNLLEAGFDGVLLDVREPDEYAWAHIEGSRLAPLSEFMSHLSELPPDPAYLVYCKVGQRSAHAGTMMLEAGFRNVTNIQGGIMAWIELGCPVAEG